MQSVKPGPRASRLQQRRNTRNPLLWAVATYCAGLIVGRYLWRPFLWWLVAALMFATYAVYLRGRRARMGFVFSCSVLFLVACLNIRAGLPARITGLGAFFDGQELFIIGHVIHQGELVEHGKAEVQQRFDIESERIETEDQVLSLRACIRVSIYSRLQGTADSAHIFRYGERLRFPTKLSHPRNFRNPGSFDYEGYLADSGIAALGFTKAENVEILSGFSGNHVELLRARAYTEIRDRIQQLWTGKDAALMQAMLIGDNAFVGRSLLTDFQRTGTYHVLVISGLKVSILALVTFWLLRRCRVNAPASSAVTILLTVAYAALTDVGAPVWRATLMLIIYFCAKTLYRDRAALNTIAAAALIFLLTRPSALFGTSFQLSFLCVLIIAGISVPLIERTVQPFSAAVRNLNIVAYDFALPPELVQFRIDLRMIADRLQRFVGVRLSVFVLVAVVRGTVLGWSFFWSPLFCNLDSLCQWPITSIGRLWCRFPQT